MSVPEYIQLLNLKIAPKSDRQTLIDEINTSSLSIGDVPTFAETIINNELQVSINLADHLISNLTDPKLIIDIVGSISEPINREQAEKFLHQLQEPYSNLLLEQPSELAYSYSNEQLLKKLKEWTLIGGYKKRKEKLSVEPFQLLPPSP